MKVRELIAVLEKFSPDTTIILQGASDRRYPQWAWKDTPVAISFYGAPPVIRLIGDGNDCNEFGSPVK